MPLLRGTSISYATFGEAVEIIEARCTDTELRLSYEEGGRRMCVSANSTDGTNFEGTWSGARERNASPEGKVSLKLVRGQRAELVLYGTWREFEGDAGGWIIELHEA